MKRLLICLLFAAVGVLVFISMHSMRPNERGTQDRVISKIPVDSEPPTSSRQNRVEGIGYVEPRSEIRRLVPQAGGVIQQCAVPAGAFVRKGDLLVVIESATQQAQFSFAQARLELARADGAKVRSGINPLRIELEQRTLERLKMRLQFAKIRHERAKKVFSRNASSEQDLDDASNEQEQAVMAVAEQEAAVCHLQKSVTNADILVAEANVSVAEAAVRQAEHAVSTTRLLAPEDGTVLRWLKREGEGVSTVAPEPVLLFGDLSRLHVRAEIDERSATVVKPGMAAEVYGTNLNDSTCHGTVLRVEPVMGSKTVFTQSATERKDLDVVQVVIEMEESFIAPSGLRVDVRLFMNLPRKDLTLTKP